MTAGQSITSAADFLSYWGSLRIQNWIKGNLQLPCIKVNVLYSTVQSLHHNTVCACTVAQVLKKSTALRSGH